MLKEEATESTDVGLMAVINKLRGEVVPIEAVDNMQAVMSQAMTETCIQAADTILQQQAILVPAIHEYFSVKIRECVTATHLQGEQEQVTAWWILSNLVVNLDNHLIYACRVCKCGTLLIFCRNQVSSWHGTGSTTHFFSL